MLYSSCAGIVLTYAPLNNVYGKICALPWIDRIQKFLTKINSHFDLFKKNVYSKYFTLKMQSLLSYLFYHRAKILYYCIVCNSCKKKRKYPEIVHIMPIFEPEMCNIYVLKKSQIKMCWDSVNYQTYRKRQCSLTLTFKFTAITSWLSII